MKAQEITFPIEAQVSIVVTEDAPDDLFSRVETDMFDNIYPWMIKDDIAAHWAHNAVANGVTDVSRLDGWADVPPGAVTFDVDDVVLALDHTTLEGEM